MYEAVNMENGQGKVTHFSVKNDASPLDLTGSTDSEAPCGYEVHGAEEQQIKLYTCPQCYHQYTTYYRLKKHIQTCQATPVYPQDQAPYDAIQLVPNATQFPVRPVQRSLVKTKPSEPPYPHPRNNTTAGNRRVLPGLIPRSQVATILVPSGHRYVANEHLQHIQNSEFLYANSNDPQASYNLVKQPGLHDIQVLDTPQAERPFVPNVNCQKTRPTFHHLDNGGLRDVQILGNPHQLVHADSHGPHPSFDQISHSGLSQEVQSASGKQHFITTDDGQVHLVQTLNFKTRLQAPSHNFHSKTNPPAHYTGAHLYNVPDKLLHYDSVPQTPNQMKQHNFTVQQRIPSNPHIAHDPQPSVLYAPQNGLQATPGGVHYNTTAHNHSRRQLTNQSLSNKPKQPNRILRSPHAQLSPSSVKKSRSLNKSTLRNKLEEFKRKNEKNLLKFKNKIRKKTKLAEQRRINLLMTVQEGQKPYKCNICEKCFSVAFRAKRHIASHLGVRPYKCTFCFKSFNQAQTLNEHIKSHGSSGEPMKQQKKTDISISESVERSWSNSEATTPEAENAIQNELHEDGKPYKCGVCPMQFSFYLELEKHGEVHRTEKLFDCEICSTKFASQDELNEHTLWHQNKKHFYQCPKCPQKFYHIKVLKRHVKREHKCNLLMPISQPVRQIKENQKSKRGAIQHIDLTTYAPEPPERPVLPATPKQQTLAHPAHCKASPNNDIDGKFHEYYYDSMSTNTTDSSSLEQHDEFPDKNEPVTDASKPNITFKLQKIKMNASTTVRIKATRKYFKCQICTSTFYKDSEYNKHMKEHEEGMTFTCMACDITFSTSSELNRHYATHPGVRPYKCTVCDKAFIQATHLKFHMRRHTGEKPYQCKVCNRRFPRLAHLQEHMFLHTGEKLHKCTVCGKRFTQPTGLRSHMKRTHPAQVKQTYKCPYCPVSFESKQARSLHILSVHQEEDMVSTTSPSTASTEATNDDSSTTTRSSKTDIDGLPNTPCFNQIIALPVKMMSDRIVVHYEDKLLMEWTYDNSNV